MVLEALKALQYEGTKAEAAQNFKEQGNECVQEKKWSDAKEFYTKGIAVLQHKEEGKWDQPSDPAQEEKQRKLLTEQLYINRARCNLELSRTHHHVPLSRLTKSRKLSFDYSRLQRCPQGQSRECKSPLPVSIGSFCPRQGLRGSRCVLSRPEVG